MQLGSCIIESRNSKHKAASETITTASLGQLPRALVGETASFLPQLAYARFSQSCRFLFLACHSPNVLCELDLRNVSNEHHLDLAQFVSVKSLLASGDTLNEWVPQRRAFSRLQAVTLDSESFPRQVHKFDKFIRPLTFEKVNIVNCRLLKIISAHDLLDLLAAFPNVECLQLAWIHFQHTNTDSLIFAGRRPALTRLRSLNLWSADPQNIFNIPLLYAVGQQLHHLNLILQHSFEWDADRICFGRLQELIVRLFTGTLRTMATICDSATNLKRVKLRFVSLTSRGDRFETAAIVQCLTMLFTRCPLLLTCYVTFAKKDTVPFDCALRALRCALCDDKWRARNELVLFMDVRNVSRDEGDFLPAVQQTVDALTVSGIEHIAVFFTSTALITEQKDKQLLNRVKSNRITATLHTISSSTYWHNS